ncbi:MAG TPA: diguanylate cyclase, partial [Mariprofundaceae bacterium]|nr:diguanylate cyclase [Mariprofundaceae bacterium]
MVSTLRQYAFAIALSLAGIVIISSTLFSIRIAHDVADVHAPLVDAAMEIKLELLMASFEFEENIIDAEHAKPDVMEKHINQAKWYARAMLSGGENSEGVYVPVDDKKLTERILTTLEGITQIQELFRKHGSDMINARQGGKVDKEFEHLFKEVLNDADLTENELLAILVQKRYLQRLINYGALIVSISLFIFILYYFVSRRRAELALINKLNDLAVRDELTGVPNRRCFNVTLTNEWNHALRARYTFSLAICDIDYFKEYND